MTLEQAAAAAGAHILHPSDQTLHGAAYDNRKVRPGDLFVAIAGERADGHDFATSAVEAGAVAVLAERDPFPEGAKAPVLLVKNSVAALGKIGHAWRKAFSGKVIGITGTAGKTTTKELLAHILEQRGRTARTPMNLNTQIGLPVSMMMADGKEHFWVMEAGISQPFDMDELGPVMEPDVAILLNAGTGHTLGLGEKGAAHYKSRLLSYLSKGGRALVCADYDDLVQEALTICPDAELFSTQGRKAAYTGTYLGLDETGRGNYRLDFAGETLTVDCALSGSYAAENILAAAAAARILGLSMEEIACGIRTAPLPAQRFSRRQLQGWTVIDDTYNANPLSSARMVEAAAELAGQRPFLCVMGEMLELGEEAVVEHLRLGKALASSGCRAVFWTGGHASDVEKGLSEQGYEGVFIPLSGPDSFLPELDAWKKEHAIDEGLILFKGSRGNRLERLVTLFMERDTHAL